MDYKKDFPIFNNRDIAYLDSGATTQKPQYVIDAIDEFYEHNNANPHRGAYSLSIDATNVYEGTREKIAKFINARKANEIIFSKNASESLNLIAYSYGLDNLKKDDEVVLSIMEHHSNLVPWQYVTKKTGASLKYMYINDEFELSKEEIESKITDKTRIVGITHVSNVLGTINNVKEIIKYAHKKGAVVIVDASQSIPHMKIDVQDLDADFIVFSGHKMFAPLGIGVLYGKEKLLNNMNPFLMSGQHHGDPGNRDQGSGSDLSLCQGRQNRPLWRRRSGQNGAHHGTHQQHRQRARRHFRLHRCGRAHPGGQRPVQRDEAVRRPGQDRLGLWSDERAAWSQNASRPVRSHHGGVFPGCEASGCAPLH